MKKAAFRIALGSALALSSLSALATDTIVNCGATVDVVAGTLTGPRSFTINAGRIQSVDNVASKAANVIDLSTYTCLPGLIDMHVHLTSQSNPRSYIENFTLSPVSYTHLTLPTTGAV